MQNYKLTIEYQHLQQHGPSGVYLLPSMHDIYKFYGVIFVRNGLYSGGIFKFEVTLPLNYNTRNTYPSVKFLDYVYNPFVDELTGRLNLTQEIKEWRHFLVHVLQLIKKIFYTKDFSLSSGNLAAKHDYEQNIKSFKLFARKCVEQSKRSAMLHSHPDNPFQCSNDEENKISRNILLCLLKKNDENDNSTILEKVQRAHVKGLNKHVVHKIRENCSGANVRVQSLKTI